MTSLKESIESNKINLLVDSPHAIFQEEGFRPHWLHKSMGNFALWLAVKGYTGNKQFFYVSKSKAQVGGFIKPALEKNLSNLPNLLNKGVKRAIDKARR